MPKKAPLKDWTNTLLARLVYCRPRVASLIGVVSQYKILVYLQYKTTSKGLSHFKYVAALRCDCAWILFLYLLIAISIAYCRRLDFDANSVVASHRSHFQECRVKVVDPEAVTAGKLKGNING